MNWITLGRLAPRPLLLRRLMVLAPLALALGMAPRAAAQPFQRLGYDVPGLTQSAMAWADYDRDGDPDLAVSGLNANARFSRLYRNDGDCLVEQPRWLANVADGALAWGDYDRDGAPDLLLAGDDGVTSDSCLIRLYHNAGGRFEVAASGLPGLRACAAQWGDYDRDGWPDLALAGLTATRQVIARIYHNDHGKLADIGAKLAGCCQGRVAWGDCDGDGDLDLAVAGAAAPYGPTMLTKVYRNDAGTFTEIPGSLPGASQIEWIDYDGDGRLELSLLTDAVKLYRVSNGQFIHLRDFAGLYQSPNSQPQGRFAWGHWNWDGRPDLMLTGFVSADSYPFIREGGAIYLSGRTDFTRIEPPFSLRDGDLAWVDINNDNRPELAGLGEIISEGPAAVDISPGFMLWRNAGGLPVDLIAQYKYGPVAPRRVAWKDVNGDGYPELFTFGIDYTLPYAYPILGTSELLWNREGRLYYGQTLMDVADPSLAWGDLDGDGAADLALSGETELIDLNTSKRLYLYRNGQRLTQLSENLPSGNYSVALADFNRDGRTDVALSGNEYVYVPFWKPFNPMSDGWYIAYRHADVYRQETPTTYTAMNAGLPFAVCNLAAADYDLDGWPDLAIGNNNTSDTRTNAIYHNSGGRFANSGIKLPDLQTGRPMWIDFDRDGDPDLVFYGKTPNQAPVIKLLRNDRGGKFTDLGARLPALAANGMDWGDYDGDGDLDVALYGEDFAKVFRNAGLVFTETNLGLLNKGPMGWGDYDRDGDLDLIVGARLYRNDRIRIPKARNAAAHWRMY